ncbi:hypothetical protein [Haloplanus halophilus]|uniref:hypothetical protein n=1 Tax=Haloplanus halophilus TaxID=2949993 RepID=UPI00203DAD66|nr:hypothetical protein [Haloplanus sp. GDY1]
MTPSDGRSPRATLEALVDSPPPSLRDRALDGAGSPPAIRRPSPRPATVDVTCWTPLGDVAAADAPETGGDPAPEPMATLLADPAIPGDLDVAVDHTLVLDVEGPVRTVRVDYGSLDAAATSDHAVRVRTDDGRRVDGVSWRVADDGAFVVRFDDPPTDGALFVEYGVTRNPAGGRHTVDVVVNGERLTAARLVVLG